MSLDRNDKPAEKQGDVHKPGLKPKNAPLRTALTYLVFAVLWILLTDRLVAVNPPDFKYLPAQTIKGLVFVSASALLIYIVSMNYTRALQASEKRYRALFEQNHDAIFILDLQGKHLDVNQRAADMLGYAREELIGLSALDLSAEPEKGRQTLERLLRGEHVPLYERLFRKKNGELLPVEINVELVRDSQGSPLHIQSILRDIAERKQAVEELRENVERYRLLFESNPHPMWVYDLETLAFLMVNDAAVDHYGYTREEFLGMTLKDIRPVEEIPNLLENIVRATGSLQKTDGWKHRLKDGRLIDVEISSHALQFEGRPARLVMANDITERKKSETALKVSEENYRSLAETSDSAIAVLDRNGTILYANLTSVQIWDDPQLIGKTIHDLFPGENGSHYLADMQRVIDDQAIDLNELEVRIKGQVKWFRVSMRPLKNPDGSIHTLLLNAWDLTERKRAEENLRTSAATLAQAGKLAHLGAWRVDISNPDDLSSNPLIWSDEVYFIFGYKPGEVQVTNEFFFEHVHPDDRQAVKSAIKRAIAEKQTYEIEHRILHAMGIERVLLEHADIFYDAEGKPVRILGAVQDITERKWALETLRTSEDRYRVLTEQIPAIVYLEDATVQDRQVLYISPQVETILGITPAEWVRNDVNAWVNHIHPEDRERVTSEYNECFQRGQPFDCEYRMTASDQRVVWVRDQARAIQDEAGRPSQIHGLIYDITERKQAEKSLLESEGRYRTLFEDSPVAIWEEDFSEVKKLLDSLKQAGVSDVAAHLTSHPEAALEYIKLVRILNVNQAALRMYQSESKEELIKETVREISKGERENLLNDLIAIAEGRTSNQWEGRDETLTGQPIDISLNWSVVPGHERDYSKVIVTTIDITAQKQAFRDLQKNQHILHEAQAMAKLGSWTADLQGRIFDISPEYSALVGLEAGIHHFSELTRLIHPSDLEYATTTLNASLQTGQPVDVQFRVLVGGKLKWLHSKARFTLSKDGKPLTALGVTQDITERMQANEQLRASEARFRQLAENLEEAFWVSDPLNKIELYISPAAERIWGRAMEELIYVPNAFIGTILPEDKPLVLNALDQQARGEKTDIEYRIQRPDGSVRWVWDRAFPIQSENSNTHLVAGLAADITERKNSEARIQQQIQRLSALSAIDNVISASLDMDLTLNVFLTETMLQLKVDAADVLLLDPYMQTLEFAVGQGFHTNAIQNFKMQLGEGISGRAILARQPAHIPDLSAVGEQFLRASILRDDNFITYFGIPLVAKGQLKGVLEVFHRSPLDPDPEWLDFLKTLASQAAIAIDNAQLFENMQRSNTELSMAYDATIAGWSHAMDLRDKETEGHTQRVTQLSLRLAERMGVSKQELIHIRRGALLHDIGKLGVPDQILLKPDKLTDEEWDIMRRHPTYAYEMLHTINYLRPALDIPYYHHEKWDGTGYPQGLKGEQIPQAARIFAIVDVWDALHADRPYRPGWPVEKIRGHIREQSGLHFDPKVVEAFLGMMDELSPRS